MALRDGNPRAIKGPIQEPDETVFTIDNTTKCDPSKKVKKKDDWPSVTPRPKGIS